ncbi:neuromedin-B isoform X1 [Sorex fumeus]|uniref:neuromedin-B isoform X1 n=1 Tax=Sorex fumeus TaxID=62283 RepID=UPI0024ACD6BB|nr:neuromedin-B isoform X1 [Sorex fumeus]
MSRRAGRPRLLFLLLTLLVASAAPLSWDPPEPSGRAASKIRVHPRGNLWATGHFMGKKSLEPPNPSPLESTPQISPRDRQLQLSPDLLRILFLKRALGLGHGNPAPSPQEAAGANAAEVLPLGRKI